MRPLSAAELLDVWERGTTRPPAERALALLGAACPELPDEDLRALPLGPRDARLLTLREWAFGTGFEALASCPSCGGELELKFAAPNIRAEPAGPSAGPHALRSGDWSIRFRLPTSDDVLACGRAGAASERDLLDRLVIEVSWDGEPAELESVPAEVLDELEVRMAELDAQADMHLDLTCTCCGYEWLASFDLVSYFWAEIESWARRVLSHVHEIAAAYGWSEGQILDLSPRRRSLYLQMVRG